MYYHFVYERPPTRILGRQSARMPMATRANPDQKHRPGYLVYLGFGLEDRRSQVGDHWMFLGLQPYRHLKDPRL